jgi:hypothetical protein
MALLLLCLGAMVWKVVQWQSAVRTRVLAFAALDLTFWTITGWCLHFFDISSFIKFDKTLAALDTRWFFDAAWCRAAMSIPGIGIATNVAYYSLAYVAMVWYGWLAAEGGGWKLIQSLVLAYVVGPMFFLLVPAYGPMPAFSGRPNCMPSLHMATAILLAIYRPTNGLWVGVVYVALTAWATLATGEHYVIDLVMAIPFSAFIWAAVERRWRLAAGLLAVVICAILAIRLAG